MDGHNQGRMTFIYRFVIYAIGFLLFCEWLRPLETVTETEDVSVFYIYGAFCFFISFLQVQWWLSMPLKLIGMAFIIDGLYIGERIFSMEWMTIVYQQMLFNVEVIQTREWWQMTPLFRSLLFLILLWLMSYLLYYWFVIAKRMFLFVVMTIIYVTVLDTFTVYDGQWAIVRTFVLAMLALGLSSFLKEMDKESISVSNFRKAHIWVFPLVLITLFSTIAGYASPKLDPQWPDPVPYIESAAGGAGGGPGGGGAIQKVGYGENDSRLGGSFVQDDTPVFKALADGRRYWRIESKDTYTGKGWEDTLAQPVNDVGNVQYKTFTDQVETEEKSSFIRMERGASFNKLVYPYGLSSLNEEIIPPGYRFRVHENTGEIDTVKGDSPGRLGEYVVRYDFPSFEYQQLRETDSEDPDEIQEKYLQLPDSLPNRVKNLAGQIMKDKENRYDRAKAVETYFSANGFEYTTDNVPVPKKNQDYVDQFLFETQYGYCDNYSTSMVVMLRSQGIPARWVKGFTGGEKIDTTANDNGDIQNLYQVTSSNAHSWVEVYFPDIGWVPFEPTQGFTNNADFYSDINGEDEDGAATEEDDSTTDSEIGNPQQVEDSASNGSDAALGSSSDRSYTWVWWTLAGAVAAGLILYFTRYRWMTAWLIWRYRRNKDEKTYEKAYTYLLTVLNHKGIKRNPDQTLREYARMVDTHFQTNEMRRLTNSYERTLYRNEDQSKEWGKVTELWENLIKKALS
ncbi:DUF4129 domain-containing transglutaminase family protein [Halobacillus yeomjeoni]|uniref:DUF4129 domain-containing protein n=1 Tax=Halobacillus yeomjeoni TaxID=311194 RepID=A0A931MWG5_9BACI|nr:transglutaminase domain-containing protein [Halobacillus yeomjeoni]MBH0231480.1 DUF4129 domain-containing protein [Halobacillus yeomjeoni]